MATGGEENTGNGGGGGGVPNTPANNEHHGSPQQKVSLPRRAPTGPIPTRTWQVHLGASGNMVEYHEEREQENQCVRSQRAIVSRTTRCEASVSGGKVSLGWATTAVRTGSGFPYPP